MQSGGGLGRSGGGLGTVWGRSWAILGCLGAVLSASGEATCEHGGSKRLKEGVLEAKNPPRRPARDQESSKKPFWCNFGNQFGGLFLHIFCSKIGFNFEYVFGLVFASALSKQVTKIDPESPQHGTRRPEKVPR